MWRMCCKVPKEGYSGTLTFWKKVRNSSKKADAFTVYGICFFD